VGKEDIGARTNWGKARPENYKAMRGSPIRKMGAKGSPLGDLARIHLPW